MGRFMRLKSLITPLILTTSLSGCGDSPRPPIIEQRPTQTYCDSDVNIKTGVMKKKCIEYNLDTRKPFRTHLYTFDPIKGSSAETIEDSSQKPGMNIWCYGRPPIVEQRLTKPYCNPDVNTKTGVITKKCIEYNLDTQRPFRTHLYTFDPIKGVTSETIEDSSQEPGMNIWCDGRVYVYP